MTTSVGTSANADANANADTWGSTIALPGLRPGELKRDFVASKMDVISARKRIVDTIVVNDVASTRRSDIIHVVIQFL